MRVRIPDVVDCPEATPANRCAALSPASPGCLLLVPRVHIRGGCSQSVAILENQRTQSFGSLVPAFNFFKPSYSIFIAIDWCFGLLPDICQPYPFMKFYVKKEFYLNTYVTMYIAFCCPAPSETSEEESPARGPVLPSTALHTGTRM